MILDRLTDYVFDNLWSNPGLDKNFLIMPNMLSSRDGIINVLSLPYNRITMPTALDRYMVFEIGSVYPGIIGIDEDIFFWVNLADLINQSELLAYIFLNHQLIDPCNVYVRRIQNKNIIIAIKRNPYRELFNSPYEMFFKVYNNEWFNTTDAGLSGVPTVLSQKITTTEETGSVLTGYYAAKSANKFPLAYVNGVYVDDVTPSELKVGDYISIFFDDSIIGYWDVELNATPYFLSEVVEDDGRNERRYLVSCPQEYRGNFNYKDDMEFFVLGQGKLSDTGVTRNLGFIIPTFTKNSISTISPCDYGIETDLVEAIGAQNEDKADFNLWPRLRIFARRNDEKKILVKDGNLWFFLNILPEDLRTRLMAGDLSLVETWRAVKLETSSFKEFIEMNSADAHTVYNDPYTGLEDVLSYFEIHDAMEGKVLKEGDEYPIAMELGGTIIYFTDEGLFHSVDYVENYEGSGVIPEFPEGAARAKCIPGKTYFTDAAWDARFNSDEDYGSTDFNEVRYYISDERNLTRAVEDAHYTVRESDRKIIWNDDILAEPNVKFYRRKAGEVRYLQHTLTDVGVDLTILNPSTDENENDIRFGAVEIWMNKYRLVDGLDYTTKLTGDGLLVVLQNHEYLSGTGTEVFDIIMHGVSRDADEAYPELEIGWIREHQLSRNGRFNYVVGTSQNVFVGGRAIFDEEMEIDELEVGTLPEWIKDGMPYSIEPRTQHFYRHIINNFSFARENAYEQLASYEDLLSSYLVESSASEPWVIESKYGIFSSFMNVIIRAIKDGDLVIDGPMSNYETIQAIGPYSSYLDSDLTNVYGEETPVEVYPHSSTDIILLTSEEYDFIESINTTYFNDRIRINAGLSVIGE